VTGYSPRGPNIEAVWRFRASLGPTCSPKDPGERPRFWVVARCRLVFAEDWLEFPVCDTQNTANRSKHVTGKTHRTETPRPASTAGGHAGELQHPFVQVASGYTTVGERGILGNTGQHRALKNLHMVG